MKRIFSLFMVLTMLISLMASSMVYGADYKVKIGSNKDLLKHEESCSGDITISNVATGINAFEVTILTDEALEVTSISYAGLTLDSNNTYGFNDTDTLGVLSIDSTGIKAAFSRTNGGIFTQEIIINLELTALNTSITHIKDSVLTLSEITLLDINGEEITLSENDIFSSVAMNILTTAMGDKIDEVIHLIAAVPEPASVTLANESHIIAARTATEEMKIMAATKSDFAVSLVNEQKIIDSEAQIITLYSEINDVETQINALPDVDGLTINNTNDIESARVALEALSDLQELRVSTAAKVKLQNLEEQLGVLGVKKDALSGSISRTGVILSEHEVGTAAGDVTQATKTALQTAVDTAQVIYDDAMNKTETELSTADDDLNEAINIFLSNIITEDQEKKTLLATELANGQAILDSVGTSVIIGTNVGEFQQEALDDLQTVQNYAQVVYDDSQSIAIDYEHARMLLIDAIVIFQNSQYTTMDVANRTLDETIETAETLLNEAVFGTLVGQYPVSSRDALADALATAKVTVRDTVDHVNTASSTLQSAITDFEISVITHTDVVAKKVTALFTDTNKDALASDVIESKIDSLEVEVNNLPASTEKTNLLADIATAKVLFNTPVKVVIYAEEKGTAYIEKDETLQLLTKVYNALNIELMGSDITWITGNSGTVSVVNGLVTGIEEGQTTITAAITGNTSINSVVNMTVFVVPDLMVSNIPNGAFFNNDVTVYAYRDGQNITITEGGTELATGANVADVIVTGDGEHTIDISSTGGGEATAQLVFNIDTTAPGVMMPTIEDVVDDTVTISTLPTFDDDNLDETTKVVYLEKLVDGQYKFYKTVEVNDIISGQGSYRLVGFVMDVAGNESTNYETFEIELDMEKPTISVSGIEDINTSDVTIGVNLTGGSNSSNYYYQAILTQPDMSIEDDNNNIDNTTFSEPGKYTLEITAYNPNNTEESSSFFKAFIVDKNNPIITFDAPDNNGKYNYSVTPMIAVSDADDILSMNELEDNINLTLLKNGSPIAYTKGSTIISEGSYVLTAVVTDAVGKTDTATVSFSIDKTKPAINVTGVEDGEVYYEDKVVTVTTDADALLTIVDKNGNPINFANNSTTFSKVDGETVSYTMKITAIDLAGNETTDKVSFAIDAMPVVFSVTGLTEGALVKQLPNNILCSVQDGSDIYSLTPVFTKANGTVFDGSDGEQKLSLTYEKGGITYTKTVNFIIDATSPNINNEEIKLEGVAQNSDFTSKAGKEIDIQADITDATSGLKNVYAEVGDISGKIQLTSADGTRYSGTYIIGTGNYTNQIIKITAEDYAGNVKIINTYNVSADNIAPSVSAKITPNGLPDGENNYYVNASTKVELLKDDSTATIKYCLNGGAETLYSDLISPIDGKLNTITYYAEDSVGNKSDVKTIELKFDATAPMTPTIISPVENSETKQKLAVIEGTVNNEGGKGTKIILEKDGNIIQSGFIAADDSFVFADVSLNEGDNTYTVYAKDIAGNISSGTHTVTILLDSTAPVFDVDKINDTTYVVNTNETVQNIVVTFNGVGIDAGSITQSGNEYTITTPNPQEGSNQLIIVGEDTVGNLGSGSMSTNYMPPNVSQEDVPVTGGTTIDIPEDAFAVTTILTVQTVEAQDQTEYKTLGSPIQYNFTTKPTEPIIITSFVGSGLQGVGIIHISDSGVADDFVPAIYQSPIDFNNLVEDQPYYDNVSGNLVLRTKNFSIYQNGQDSTNPVIDITTTDYEISNGETAIIAGKITDNDPNVKIVEVIIDGTSQVVSETSPFNITLDLGEGTHEVQIVAEDGGSNQTAITKIYVVDTIIPSINATAAAAVTDQKTGTIHVNTSESVEVKVEGQVIGTILGEDNINLDLAMGPNSITLTAKDAMGNEKTETVVITRVATVELIITHDDTTNQSLATISGNINVSADIYINDVLKHNHINGNFTIEITLVEGDNEFTIKAEDALGNIREETITITYEPDQQQGNGDNNGGAFLPVPIEMVEAVIETTEPLTKLGGTIGFDNLGIEMVFEPNTVDEDAEITVKQLEEENDVFVVNGDTKVETDINTGYMQLKLAGKVYEFTSSSKLNKPITVTFEIDTDNMTDEEMDCLGIYYLNEVTGEWEFINGEFDRINGTISVELEHFSIYALMSYAKTFSDIQNHWAKEYIESLASMHIIDGVSKTSYAPDKDITRAQFAKLLVEMLNIETDDNITNKFSDINGSEWYANYVNVAKAAGIVGGYPDGTFKPNTNVSRQEMAAMVMNAYSYSLGIDYKDTYTGEGYKFADDNNIDGWAKPAVEGAKILGIINGKGDNIFDPKANATRAEAAKMLRVFFDVIQ